MKTIYDIPNILNDISNNLNNIANTLDLMNEKMGKNGKKAKKIKPQSNKLQALLENIKKDKDPNADNQPAEDILAMIRKRNEDK